MSTITIPDDVLQSADEYIINGEKFYRFEFWMRPTETPSVMEMVAHPRKNKKPATRTGYCKLTHEQWADRRAKAKADRIRTLEERRAARISKKEASIEIGRIFVINPDKKTSVREIYRQRAAFFNKNISLKFTPKGDMLEVEVIEKPIREKYEKVVTKSGKTNYYKINRPKRIKKEKPVKVPKISRYKLRDAKPGDTYIIHKSKAVSFQNNFSMFRDKWPNIYWIKKEHDDDHVIYTITESESRRAGYIPKSIIDKILSDNRKTTEIAKEFNLPYNTVWAIKKRYKSTLKLLQ